MFASEYVDLIDNLHKNPLNSKLLLFFSYFLVNAADRIIRVYATNEVLTCGKDGEPEPMQKLQDLVNK